MTLKSTAKESIWARGALWAPMHSGVWGEFGAFEP